VVAAFFVAIFPGNIAQYVEGNDGFGLDTDGKRLARLFFQPLLVAWALWSTGASGALARWIRERRRRDSPLTARWRRGGGAVIRRVGAPWPRQRLDVPERSERPRNESTSDAQCCVADLDRPATKHGTATVRPSLSSQSRPSATASASSNWRRATGPRRPRRRTRREVRTEKTSSQLTALA
jgi:hypothetical protein